MLALLVGLFGGFELLANARQAASLRDQVAAKDQAGQDTTSDQVALEQFSHSHMNATVRLELMGSYGRAVAASQPATPSGALYAQAQAACAGKSDSIVQAKCVTDYVSKRLPAPAAPVAPPDRSLFTKEFHSPAWTPDLAGLALLGSLVLVLIAIFARVLAPRPRY